MKKSLIVIILIVSILFIYGCGKKEEDNVSNTTNNNIDNTNTVTNEKEYNFYDKSRLTGQTYASYKEAFNNFSFVISDSLSEDSKKHNLSFIGDETVVPFEISQEGLSAYFLYDDVKVIVASVKNIKKEDLRNEYNKYIASLKESLEKEDEYTKKSLKYEIIEDNNSNLYLKTFYQTKIETNNTLLTNYLIRYYKVIDDNTVIEFVTGYNYKYDEKNTKESERFAQTYKEYTKRFDSKLLGALTKISNNVVLDNGSPYLFDKIIYTNNALSKHIKNSSYINSISIKNGNLFIAYKNVDYNQNFIDEYYSMVIVLTEYEYISTTNYSHRTYWEEETKTISNNPQIIVSGIDKNTIKVINGDRTEYYHFNGRKSNNPNKLKDSIESMNDFNNNLSIFFE